MPTWTNWECDGKPLSQGFLSLMNIYSRISLDGSIAVNYETLRVNFHVKTLSWIRCWVHTTYFTWNTVHCKLMHGSISTSIPISLHFTNVISSFAWQSHIWKASGIIVGSRGIFIPIDSMTLTAVTDPILVVLTWTTFESSEFFVGQCRCLKNGLNSFNIPFRKSKISKY